MQMADSYGFGAQGSLAWRPGVDAQRSHETDELLQAAYEQAKVMLKRNERALRKLADALIQRQELSRPEVEDLVGAWRAGTSAH